jgi:hypothetical protein
VGVTLSSAISGKSSASLPESLLSDDGVVTEVSCDMLGVILSVLCVATSTPRERFGNLVFVNLAFSFFATPEVWVGKKVFCEREKMGHEPKKILNLRFLTPFGQALSPPDAQSKQSVIQTTQTVNLAYRMFVLNNPLVRTKVEADDTENKLQLPGIEPSKPPCSRAVSPKP